MPKRLTPLGDGRLVGYHYTSKSLWDQIKNEGLVPYTITSEDLRIMHPAPLKGIWLWKQDMIGKSNAGAILYQVITKQDPVVVKLRVEYELEDLLHYNGHPVEMPHQGFLGATQYHECDVGVIHLPAIPVDRIEVIKEYDVITLLK